MTLPTLPTFYYLDHFTEMLSSVADIYAAILSDEHHRFIARFCSLSKDGQCLLIRMVNRRGRVFRRDALRYAEISDIGAALDELRGGGYIRALHQDDYAAFLACLSKASLLQGAKTARADGVRTAWAKSKITEWFVAEIPFEHAALCCRGHEFVVLDNLLPLQFLLYLYFGKTESDLKQFALRDLGIMRTNTIASISARFSDAEEAYACFHYSRLSDTLEQKTVAVYQAAAEAILEGPAATTDYAADLKSRAACETGQFFEKRGDRELAIRLYRAGTSPDCHERLVRILYANGDKASAEELLRRLIDDPASDDEYLFATDFYARKYGGQRTSACTELLRSGRTVVVDDIRRGNPEAGVAGVMRREGWKVFFAENTLWQSLFGLIFWEELFESGQLHSNFDWMPQCLKDRSFKRVFAPQIAQKLEIIRAGNALGSILRIIAAKWGKPNGVFAWDRVQVEALRALLATAPPEGIVAMLEVMSRDYTQTHDGFPDLMLVHGSELLFLEVKAEGDAVRRNQLTRLRQLRNGGINAEIARVEYAFDPEQEYVVVDVETTGSWGNGDRITEIGAVKIRNHRVVDEWHSLINPQRTIPQRITQLTGITNAMVRDAPLFAEIADSFMAFMGDAIFVAHSVNFDYGFIASEYERLERRFRFPKLCTCASMRRNYPGHKSYSLGNLCAIYEIALEDHHRALCDARAAAHLLNLINRKRGMRPESEVAAA
jgi:DNA polymerase-3 subunit epsilon